MQLRADNETVQLLGPRQARVRSSGGVDWYAVDLDEGKGFCTCLGFSYRKSCRHLDVVRRIATGKAKVDLQERLIETFDPAKLDLATSRYRAYETIASSGRVPVGITVGKPKWKLPYEVAGYVGEIAPYGAMFKLTGDAFGEAYLKRIEDYGVEVIGPALAAYGDFLVLLCYEDVLKGESCHRRRFAEWWTTMTGQDVPELPGDGVAVKHARALARETQARILLPGPTSEVAA